MNKKFPKTERSRIIIHYLNKVCWQDKKFAIFGIKWYINMSEKEQENVTGHNNNIKYIVINLKGIHGHTKMGYCNIFCIGIIKLIRLAKSRSQVQSLLLWK